MEKGTGGGALAVIDHLAKKKNATEAQISLAWMMSKKPWIVPIPGTTKKERMIENTGAADIQLTSDEIAWLNHELDGIDISSMRY